MLATSFSFFHNSFFTFSKGNFILWVTFTLSPANALSLDRSKFLPQIFCLKLFSFTSGHQEILDLSKFKKKKTLCFVCADHIMNEPHMKIDVFYKVENIVGVGGNVGFPKSLLCSGSLKLGIVL